MLAHLAPLLIVSLASGQSRAACSALAASHASSFDQATEEDQAKASLYNGGVELEGLGCPAEASELYHTFVKRWPADERSEALAFRVATQAASGLDLERAIALFDDYWKSYPTSEHCSTAIFEAARLRLAIGDLEGAASGFEHYGTRWARHEDAAETLIKACDTWARVDGVSAISCWHNALKYHGKHHLTLTLRAYHARIDLLEAEGRMEEAERSRKAVLTTFDRMVEAGEECPSHERSLAASIAMEAVEAPAVKIGDAELSGDVQTDAELTKEVVPRWVGDLDQACTQHVSKYRDPATMAECAFLRAFARYRLAELLRAKGENGPLSEALVIRGEERCVEAFAQAQILEAWHPGHDRCLGLMHEHHPERYPALKEELRLGR